MNWNSKTVAELTNQDRALVRLLQEDCRLTNQELADRTGMSASVCWRRVRALEETGVISRYAAIVDPDAAGLKFRAMVHVSLARTDAATVHSFLEEVGRRPEVLQCYATSGSPDYHMLVMCRDLDDYNRFYDEFLFERSCVGQVSMHLIVKTVKSDVKLPV
ncbi:AsnC family transcriptional regulator [Labrenzia sp. VG12]|nr:AsnC family transcriptional regulator [Labrenzia sp. VG12]